jgi:hypothetical protein
MGGRHVRYLKSLILVESTIPARLDMKIRVFPEITILALALLGALGLADEAWRASTPVPLVQFLQNHHLGHLWNELRWQHGYSHEILHFLSGVAGSVLGCWIYFAIQKRST